MNNPGNTPLTSDYVTAYLRGGTDGFMLKGGDATQGGLAVMCASQGKPRRGIA